MGQRLGEDDGRTGPSGYAGHHRMYTPRQVAPRRRHGKVPLVRPRQTTETTSIADGVLQLVGNSDKAIAVCIALHVSVEVVGDQFIRPRRIQQPSVATMNRPTRKILIKDAMGVYVDMIDAEGWVLQQYVDWLKFTLETSLITGQP